MKKGVAVAVAVALAVALVAAVPKVSYAGGRAAEGALIGVGSVLVLQSLGLFPSPRPIFQRPERVIVVREPVTVYYPPPRYDPPPYERDWVPGHWEDGVWVEGHYEYRPIEPSYYSGPPYGRKFRSYRSSYRPEYRSYRSYYRPW